MEVFVIIIPPIIALFIGAWAVLAPQPSDPVTERAQVDQHIAWLEARLQHGRAGNWDEQMMANLLAQLETARGKQSAMRAV